MKTVTILLLLALCVGGLVFAEDQTTVTPLPAGYVKSADGTTHLFNPNNPKATLIVVRIIELEQKDASTESARAMVKALSVAISHANSNNLILPDHLNALAKAVQTRQKDLDQERKKSNYGAMLDYLTLAIPQFILTYTASLPKK